MSRSIPFLILFMIAPANAAIEISPTQPGTMHQRMQWSIRLDREYKNPFDPDEIAVDATFTGPGGRELIVPAFWFMPGRTESEPTTQEITAEQLKEASFVVRFAPPAPGAWTMTVVAKDAEGTARSSTVSFEVKPAAADVRGMVRRSPKNSRYLQFDSGEPFFMIGPNVCWANSRGIAQ